MSNIEQGILPAFKIPILKAAESNVEVKKWEIP